MNVVMLKKGKGKGREGKGGITPLILLSPFRIPLPPCFGIKPLPISLTTQHIYFMQMMWIDAVSMVFIGIGWTFS